MGVVVSWAITPVSAGVEDFFNEKKKRFEGDGPDPQHRLHS
jgi:hypothetical protein